MTERKSMPNMNAIKSASTIKFNSKEAYGDRRISSPRPLDRDSIETSKRYQSNIPKPKVDYRSVQRNFAMSKSD